MQAYQRLRGASLHSQSTNSKGSPSLCSSSLSVRTSIIFQGHRKQRCMTSASAFGHEAADPASAPIPVLRLERREALALLAGMTALSASPSWAEEGATSAPEAPSPSPATPTQVPPPSAAPAPPLDPYFSYPFVSSVPGNLRTKEYHSIITRNRPALWQRVAQMIQQSDYSSLSDDLNVAPFADLRQAALFIPWALLQRDDFSTAVDARKAYNDFNAHVQDLQMAAVSAAAGDADPQRVQQAFILMSASLDSFLSTIPGSYLGNGPKAG